MKSKNLLKNIKVHKIILLLDEKNLINKTFAKHQLIDIQ